MRLSTQLFTDSLFPVATIETDLDSKDTNVTGGVLHGQTWHSEGFAQAVARHRAAIGRAIRGEMEIEWERWEAMALFDEERRWGEADETDKQTAAADAAQEGTG